MTLHSDRVRIVAAGLLFALVAATECATVLAAAAPVAKAAAGETLSLNGPGGTGLMFSADGKRLLVAGGDECTIWDTRTGRRIAGPLKHGDGQALLLSELSPDQKHVLTVSADTLRLWDAETGQLRHTLRHGAVIQCAAFDHSGDRVVIGGENGEAKVWNVVDGSELVSLQHPGAVLFARFSPAGDGRLLTVAYSSRVSKGQLPKIWMWNWAGGQLLWKNVQFVGTGPRTEGYIYRRPAAFSPDGLRVAWLFWTVAIIADADAGRRGDTHGSRDFEEHMQIHGFDFSPDGSRLLAFGPHGLFVMDATVAELPVLKEIGCPGSADAYFIADGRFIVADARHSSSEAMPPLKRQFAGVWDAVTGRHILDVPMAGPADAEKREWQVIAASSDGAQLAVSLVLEQRTMVWRVPRQLPHKE